MKGLHPQVKSPALWKNTATHPDRDRCWQHLQICYCRYCSEACALVQWGDLHSVICLLSQVFGYLSIHYITFPFPRCKSQCRWHCCNSQCFCFFQINHSQTKKNQNQAYLLSGSTSSIYDQLSTPSTSCMDVVQCSQTVMHLYMMPSMLCSCYAFASISSQQFSGNCFFHLLHKNVAVRRLLLMPV